MHSFRRSDDRVDRASGNAQSTADASSLVYHSDHKRTLDPIDRIQGHRLSAQQLRERFDAAGATRRALIDFGFTGGDRFGVRTATCVTAFRALRLRQYGVDLIS
jgi:D-serine deaminase-like pyridoxal phosphate-dependent protein